MQICMYAKRYIHNLWSEEGFHKSLCSPGGECKILHVLYGVRSQNPSPAPTPYLLNTVCCRNILNLLHDIFRTWRSQSISLYEISMHDLRIYTFMQIIPVFFAWRLLERLGSCDGLNFRSVESSFIQDKTLDFFYKLECYMHFSLHPLKLWPWLLH